mmetsp:Transcript_21880/g.24428  ORF Transcript_21880/g.24428 Transcript_21880/m.24428 type:complete len:359 (+) Transcript_21880:64-1140(+)
MGNKESTRTKESDTIKIDPETLLYQLHLPPEVIQNNLVMYCGVLELCNLRVSCRQLYCAVTASFWWKDAVGLPTTHVAGNGMGDLDGNVERASFGAIDDMAIDCNGNVILVDTTHRKLKVLRMSFWNTTIKTLRGFPRFGYQNTVVAKYIATHPSTPMVYVSCSGGIYMYNSKNGEILLLVQQRQPSKILVSHGGNHLISSDKGAQLHIREIGKVYVNGPPVITPVVEMKSGIMAMCRGIHYGEYIFAYQYGKREHGWYHVAIVRVSGLLNSNGEDCIVEELARINRVSLVRKIAVDRMGVIYAATVRDGIWMIDNGKSCQLTKNISITQSLVICEDKLFFSNGSTQVGNISSIKLYD